MNEETYAKMSKLMIPNNFIKQKAPVLMFKVSMLLFHYHILLKYLKTQVYIFVITFIILA